MQETSEAPAEAAKARREGHDAADDPKACGAEGERRFAGLSVATDESGAGRKRYELEPDIGPDRGE